jgi:hypothetical protein
MALLNHPTVLSIYQYPQRQQQLPDRHVDKLSGEAKRWCQVPRVGYRTAWHSPAVSLGGLQLPTPLSCQTGSPPWQTTAGCCTWCTWAWPCCVLSRNQHLPKARSNRAAHPCPAEEAETELSSDLMQGMSRATGLALPENKPRAGREGRTCNPSSQEAEAGRSIVREKPGV